MSGSTDTRIVFGGGLALLALVILLIHAYLISRVGETVGTYALYEKPYSEVHGRLLQSSFLERNVQPVSDSQDFFNIRLRPEMNPLRLSVRTVFSDTRYADRLRARAELLDASSKAVASLNVVLQRAAPSSGTQISRDRERWSREVLRLNRSSGEFFVSTDGLYRLSTSFASEGRAEPSLVEFTIRKNVESVNKPFVFFLLFVMFLGGVIALWKNKYIQRSKQGYVPGQFKKES